MKQLRALTVFDSLPPGCALQLVSNDDSAPHIRVGEFAVIDPADTAPQHGEVYIVRRLDGTTSIRQLISRPFKSPAGGELIGWWTRCLNFVPYDDALAAARRDAPGEIPFISHLSMIDGPRLADVIQPSLLGRVIGVFETKERDAMIRAARDLDAVEILNMCRQGGFPVNARVSAATAAHRWAFGRDRALSMLAVRAVILARTPDIQDYRDQLDYLTALPLDAWVDRADTPENIRRETLAMIEHQLQQALAVRL